MPGKATASEFVNEIVCEIEKGFGFVPFLGSGISVPSGIPTSQQLDGYLAHCLHYALPTDPKAERWDPRRGKWPPFCIDNIESDESKWRWVGNVVESLSKLDRSAFANEDWQRWESVGALADWRSALHFLSRLTIKTDKDGNRRTVLSAPDPHVYDSFFTHLTTGCEPNVGHMMLARAAGPLRIQSILTTNFDCLTEEAFEKLRSPLVVFDVHHRAELPDPTLVLAQPGIVKLHGGRYGLRADYSLDEEPVDTDKHIFGDYFKGHAEDANGQSQNKPKRHLLVIGFSGEDKRIINFIKHALEDEDITRVFWVCYREDDQKSALEKLDAAEAEDGGKPGKPGKHSDRVTVTRHTDTGLLLLELYQRIRLSLPPAGVNYPAFWKVPPDRYHNDDKAIEKIFQGHRAKLTETIDDEIKRTGDTGTPDLLLLTGGRGISSVAAVVHDDLCNKRHCLWLEMDDFYGPSDFFATLVEVLASKTGVLTTHPPTFVFDPSPNMRILTAEKCAGELVRYLRDVTGTVVVFLHARDGAGVNSGTDCNGWKEETWESLGLLLSRVMQKKIMFVLMLRDTTRLRKSSPKKDSAAEQEGKNCAADGECAAPTDSQKDYRATEINDGARLLDATRCWKEKGLLAITPCRLQEDCIGYSDVKVLEEVDKWLHSGLYWRLKPRFLYTMTLFRHSRHIAGLCSWALMPDLGKNGGPDRDENRWHLVKTWLEELQACGALRHKPGGFSWMHLDLKDKIHDLLKGRCSHDAPECHEGIADWYIKLFRSSNDPFAVFESVYHRAACHDRAKDVLETNPLLVEAANRFIETSMIEAISDLQLAKERVLACGYFKACSELVNDIRGVVGEWNKAPTASEYQKGLAGTLYTVCTELLRDFSAEIGDYDKALQLNEEEFSHAPHASPVEDDCQARMPNPERDDSTEGFLKAGWKTYRKAIYYTGLRMYDEAATELLELFKVSKLDCIEDLRGRKPSDARLYARQWAEQLHTQEEFKLVIGGLRRYMFVQMLIGQITQFLEDRDRERDPGIDLADPSGKPPPTSVEIREYAELIYTLSTELMRYVGDQLFLQKQNAYFRTHYSVILSNLGRHHEAHRRLNEAAGYLDHAANRNDPVPWAVVELRRAEIYLDRARGELGYETGVIPHQDPDVRHRLICAYIDAAYGSVQRARRSLAGQRKDMWWWTWMNELDMSLCVCLSRAKEGGCAKRMAQDSALPCRTCFTPYARIRRLLGEGSCLIRLDVQRQARMGDMVLRFVKHEVQYPEARVPVLHELLTDATGKLVQVLESRSNLEKLALNGGVLRYATTVQDDMRSEEDRLQGK